MITQGVALGWYLLALQAVLAHKIGFTFYNHHKYRLLWFKGDINDRYLDLIGITLREGSKMEHIILWADDVTFNYVNTKHICRFQKNIIGQEEKNLRMRYPQLERGHFIDLYTYVYEPTEEEKRRTSKILCLSVDVS